MKSYNSTLYQAKIYNILLIVPKKKYITRLVKVLDFLKKESIKDFKMVCKNLKTIFITPYKGYFNSAFEKYGIWMSNYSILEPRNFDYKWLASGLLHEAVHIEQFKKKKRLNSHQREKEAYLVQREFLKKIKYKKAVNWLDKQLKVKWWKQFEKNANMFNKFIKLLDNYSKNELEFLKCPHFHQKIKQNTLK
jgi:hypothetical protein